LKIQLFFLKCEIGVRVAHPDFRDELTQAAREIW